MDNMDFWSWVKVSFFGALSLILTNYRLQFVLGGAMLVLMASDWITGTRAAKMQGIYSTEAARNGLEHKKGELVVLIEDPNTVPEWVQPDSTNLYSKGDRVTHNGKTWVSNIDGNVWEPGVYGWDEIE